MTLLEILGILGKIKMIKDLFYPEIEAYIIRSGMVDFAAAKKHLSNAQLDDVINRDEIVLAIGAFEQAYQSLMNALPDEWRRNLSPFPSTLEKVRTCYELGCTISLLQSHCHKILGSSNLSIIYAQQAKECFDEYERLELSMPRDVGGDNWWSRDYWWSRDDLNKILEEKFYERIAQEREIFQKTFDELIAHSSSGTTPPVQKALLDRSASLPSADTITNSSNTILLLPCGHELPTPTARFCGICGTPVLLP